MMKSVDFLGYASGLGLCGIAIYNHQGELAFAWGCVSMWALSSLLTRIREETNGED